jgi:hypothetical protein
MTEPAFTFALCSETKLVRPGELLDLAWPLEQNAQHCAAAWGLPAPAVVIANSYLELPPHCRPIVFVDGEGDPGTLAVHYWDDIRNGPAGRVYVDHTSGFREGPYSVCESAAHEILEALVDATVDQWRPHPTLRLVEVALENCDPVQDTYEIMAGGVSWPVANFVMPEWFDPSLADPIAKAKFVAAGGKFDHKRVLASPGELGPDGYEVVRARNPNGDWVYWNEWPASRKATSATRKAALEHPWSRTKHRLAGCPQYVRPVR